MFKIRSEKYNMFQGYENGGTEKWPTNMSSVIQSLLERILEHFLCSHIQKHRIYTAVRQYALDFHDSGEWFFHELNNHRNGISTVSRPYERPYASPINSDIKPFEN